MIVTVSLDLPKHRSTRILTSPRVTVSPRNQLPYRARNGHAYGSVGSSPGVALAGLIHRRPVLRGWSDGHVLVRFCLAREVVHSSGSHVGTQ
jgi:hypothetical protein